MVGNHLQLLGDIPFPEDLDFVANDFDHATGP
jgi:hypothetical protein